MHLASAVNWFGVFRALLVVGGLGLHSAGVTELTGQGLALKPCRIAGVDDELRTYNVWENHLDGVRTCHDSLARIADLTQAEVRRPPFLLDGPGRSAR